MSHGQSRRKRANDMEKLENRCLGSAIAIFLIVQGLNFCGADAFTHSLLFFWEVVKATVVSLALIGFALALLIGVIWVGNLVITGEKFRF